MNIKYRQWNIKVMGLPGKENKQESKTYTKIYLGKLYWFKINENYIITLNYQYIV